jgi:replicative DNA helicase
MAKNEIRPIQANEYGKLPPQAIELEESVLGALMIEKEAYSIVSEFLKAECFYKNANQKIYSTIQSLAMNNEPIDMHTVTEQLRKNGFIDDVGGPYYITLLTVNVSSTAHLEYHARIVYQKFLSREMIRISNEVMCMAYDDKVDVDEIMSYATKNLTEVSNFNGGSILRMNEAIEQMIKNVEFNSQDKKISSGSLTGFSDFDKRSGGIQKSDLIIIAAESSQGKTSLALSIANNISISGDAIAIYSMEMRAIQLAARFTSFESKIPANEILYGKFDLMQFQVLDSSISRLINSKIYIDEKSTSNLDSIVSSIRGMVKNYGIKGAVVDYIQLVHVSDRGMNKEQQTALIARTFKNLAKDLDIWIIALSQLSRDNTNPVPSIKRLRDSGQIEEAADIVWLIYRPEQVGRNQFPEPYETHATEGMALNYIAKGRNIGTFNFMSRFDKKTTHFFESTDYGFVQIEALRPRDFTDKPF